jgi:predicted nuclease of restriction endonuclease-like (RecB) superfamily
MSKLIKVDNEYANWIQGLSQRFRRMQVKAATRVNREMLMFYWSLGKDIIEMKAENKWGNGFLKNLSQDLKDALPGQNSFSLTNLGYMRRFYLLYESICPQVGEESSLDEKAPQLGGKLFCVPWGHHKYIIDKCGKNLDRAIFYIDKVIEYNWSRAVLLNWLSTDLFERQGKAITNFSSQLPVAQGDLAQEITKDPYNFDFLAMTEGYNEKELKDALENNIVKFLLELGSGFAFVGREYRIVIGETEKFIDLLFYNIKLHCYVVIEIKTDRFDSTNIGQLGTYIVATNHILKSEHDNPTIGLLICKEKDNVLAQYALESSSEPIGISEYELSRLYPADFKGSLPSIAEIEQQLS